MSARKASTYQSDLKNSEWLQILEILNKHTRNFGRPKKVSRRIILNAIFYILKTGCQWRMLPKDFPPWQTVYSAYRRWKISGVLHKIHDELKKN